MDPFILRNLTRDPLFSATQKRPDTTECFRIMHDSWIPLIDYWHPHTGTLNPKDAIQLLSDYKRLISGNMERLLSRHSPAYWILLGRYDQRFRWIFAQTHHNVRNDDLQILISGINALVDAACLKYGNPRLHDLATSYQTEFPPVIPTGLVTDDDLNALRSAYTLGIAYDTAHECFIFANRGVPIRVETKPPLVWLAPDAISRRHLDVYQNRTSQWVPGSSFGSLTHWESTPDLPTDSMSVFEFIRVPSTIHPIAHQDQAPHNTAYLPPYRRGQIDPTSIWDLLKLFPGAFEKANGSPPSAFFATWISLHRVTEEQFKQKPRIFHGAQLSGLAVLPKLPELITRTLPHAQDLAKNLGQGMNPRRAHELVAQCVAALTWKEVRDIDLMAQSLHPPLISTPDFTLLELTYSRELLQYLLDSVRRFDGEKSDIKGSLFEQEAEARIKAEFPAAIFWERAKSNLSLIFPDGSEGELDLAVLRGNCLLIIEAKSEVLPIGYLRGERDALRKREDQLKKALKQVEGHASKLAAHPLTTSYELPPDVEYLIPVVCTAMPEWLNLDEKDMLTPKLPRFCTPSELGRFLRDRGPKYMSRLPFAIKVKRRSR